MSPDIFTIGIICGKLGDVDGVSLEVNKWIRILREMGHRIITIAGKYVTPLAAILEEDQLLLPEIRFDSEEQKSFENQVFPNLQNHPPHMTGEKKGDLLIKLETLGNEVATILFRWVQEYSIDVIIAENTNAMPMTLLGGVGVYKLAVDRRVATIFHHHDFWWERSRFSHNHIEKFLSKTMPPAVPGIEHIVLSSYSAHILRSLKRVHPVVIPNCEDFDHPVELDDWNSDFREELNFNSEDLLVVQPTRIVRRKRIEDSVELIHALQARYPQLKPRLRFIISLYQGDEPDTEYIDEIRNLCAEKEVDIYLISTRVAAKRGRTRKGEKLYSNRDVLANADLVTYLPYWEGFGNALLEAIAARVPVVVTTYLVYKTDIKIMDFDTIELRDSYNREGRLIINDKALDRIYEVLTDRDIREKMVTHNFSIGKREFGLDSLRGSLWQVIDDYSDEIRASRKRIQKSKMNYSV
ncbi:MAG: glycosyltransferase family 4 protein [Spirochaetales bacterium]|nr:glycosyltransferase family 4 protein [Spirochaetales bacterium]